ncbi:hypothetical protein FTO70_03005 [Methanosarcina sp. KYL-1]|uniref:hypothetical protein n=1 Tax=Methanosarcina sp. KYL-1 TaxID=2602068 RepID=UPI0021018339|nr:hypothetical protein [Methanosarcina sp. KYL-1]MCQ1534676.1 hypothetical protein [Methanosarcina sp. KYL-1]
MAGREKLLLLCMAYPEISKRYKASVCMAGITEEGELRRIYPVPFEKFVNFGFHKKQWISYEIKEKGDHRKESFKIRPETLEKEEMVDDETIREICKNNVSTLDELRASWKEDKTSLGIIKPDLMDLIIRECSPDQRKVQLQKQQKLDGNFIPIDILRYDMFYKFKCFGEDEKNHKCKCLDTEAGQLYRNLVSRWGEDHPENIQKIRMRFFDWMKSRDLYFLMGTHSFHPNAWMIISLLYPPKIEPPQNRSIFDFD